MKSKDGLVSFYGTRPADRPTSAPANWQDPAVIAHPDRRNDIFTWKLTRTEDPFGNSIVYEYYQRDAEENGPRHRDQSYLKTIRYVDYPSQGKTQYLVSVTFDYDDLPERYDDGTADQKRIYPFSDYRAGFEIRTSKRCKTITIETHPEANGVIRDVPVRTYELVYLDQRSDLPVNELPRKPLQNYLRRVGRGASIAMSRSRHSHASSGAS